MRKSILLVAGVVLSVATLAACVGGPPPPPPTDPRDVLVVGDSVSFAFGCVLGDDGDSPNPCPPEPDFSARNEFSGACTITPGTILLYNGGAAPGPSCDTAPSPQHGRTWEQAADFYVPQVVVIVTAGWEIVDRWSPNGNPADPPPDAQWAGPGSTDDTAAAWYSSRLFNAINMFRSKGAKVLVANAPNMDPPTPLPDPGPGVPVASQCMWWEPYDATAPISEGPCQQGQAWRPPPGSGVGYRSSNAKVDQFNNVVDIVKNAFFPDDPDVRVFDFKSHFNGPADIYTDYVCPPPHDETVTPDPVMHQCVLPDLSVVPAILARAPDKGHLSAGGFDVLEFYLKPCVQALIPGGSPGDPSKCT